ncbi:MAG TPA: DUF3152 domain-containing protein [Acidimicrobiia bacterium]
MRIGLVVVALVASVVSVPAARAEPGAPRLYEYSVQGRGNVSDLEAFAAAAAQTYADPRGWNRGGTVRFERVPSGGDFTLWLAAAGQVATFGGACDATWSCRNGRNVVINEDRWLAASPAWIGAGGSLRDYRHMVVNHETGHWLGLGHVNCAAPGSVATIMQQQSMDLQGCTPNPWPQPLLTAQAQDAIGRDTGNIVSTAAPEG